MGKKQKKIIQTLRRTFISLLCRFRCLGFPVVVIDSSALWTKLTFRTLFLNFLQKGRIAVLLDDVIEWSWVEQKRDKTVLADYTDSVVYGLCDTFQVLPWEIKQIEEDKQKRVAASFHKAFCKTYSSLVYLNNILRLERVVYGQGYVCGADACRLFSLRHKVGRFAVENVANNNKILWENISGIAVNKTLAHNYYYGYEGTLDRKQIQEYHIKKVEGIRDAKRNEHVAGKGKLAASGYVLFLGQVYTDTSVLFSAREGWAPLDILKALAEECGLGGVDLYVKLHPKERTGRSSTTGVPYNSLTYRKMQEVTGLVNACKVLDFENSLDTFDLIRNAKVVVTLNSQVGLEAALFGKPVICCASSNYSNLGFTFDCKNKAELISCLKAALACDKQKLDKISKAAAEFDYIFNEIYCIGKSASSLVNKILNI